MSPFFPTHLFHNFIESSSNNKNRINKRERSPLKIYNAVQVKRENSIENDTGHIFAYVLNTAAIVFGAAVAVWHKIQYLKMHLF